MKSPRLSPSSACVCALFALVACAPPTPEGWHVVLEDQPGALLSVTGSGSDDIWIVGADRQDGTGPTVLHYDGARFEALSTGDTGDLWWVARAPSGAIWMAGDGGRVFRHAPGGAFEPLPTPEPVRLFGVLPFADDDVWAVGGDELTGVAVVWHYDGEAWSMPPDLDPAQLQGRVIFKIWGTSSNDVWLVGEGGTVLHRTPEGFEAIPVPTNGRLVTVHGQGEDVVSVGGFFDGLIVDLAPGACTDVTPRGLYQLQGVFVSPDGTATAVGNQGAIWQRSKERAWHQVESAPETSLSYHAVFQDPDGDLWAVGGLLDGVPLEQGILTHLGTGVRGTPVIE